MEEVKGILQSRTIWGLIVSVITGMLSKYGYAIDADLQGSIVNTILDALSVAAALYAGYGRVKATKVIGKK